MIHKFDGIDADLCPRANVFVLVDEAHRTTGGDLGNYLMGALPNATYIGFTGTPIDRLSHGKGTFKVFGVDDEQGYLDKYSIAESIDDGTTVPLHYALAPNDLRVDRETLEREFLDLREAEGVSDLEELNTILDAGRAAQGHAEDPGPGGQGRPLRGRALPAERRADGLQGVPGRRGPRGVRAVQGGPRPLPAAGVLDRRLLAGAERHRRRSKRYYLTDDEEKQVRKDFIRKDALPKILIVTEKLLTGFDAPILYCMYLDKPMRDHVLLQAIARVNRPYEDEDGQVKPYGFVLDFVGIFEKLEKALAFDSDVVASVIQNLDVLHEPVQDADARAGAGLSAARRGAWTTRPRSAPSSPCRTRSSGRRSSSSSGNCKASTTSSPPTPSCGPSSRTTAALAVLYAWIRQAYSDRVYVDREFTAKTKELLQQQTQSGDLEPPTVVYEIGQRQLLALRESSADDAVKVLNLRKLLAGARGGRRRARPYLLSIGERAAGVGRKPTTTARLTPGRP